MKIQIAENIKRNDSGKHKFLNRLFHELKEQGVEVDQKASKVDVLLHIGRNMDCCKAKKKVMRVDGLILNSDQKYEKENKKLKKQIDNSDAVVYQGEFCKQAYTKFLGVDKPYICALNGASPKEFFSRQPQDFFLTHCKWRPHKRLKELCDSFVYAKEQGLKSKLVVAGEKKKVIDHPDITYIGWVSDRYLKSLLSKSIATIHLAWLDWCPNAMIESVVAGTPVIYSKSGGSGEIGKGAGIGISDEQWDFKPTKLYDPPKLDRQEVADAMFKLETQLLEVYSEHVRINHIADKYVRIFNKLIGDSY
jgi:glycosyltransferase involved in cell wall biosynthesis